MAYRRRLPGGPGKSSGGPIWGFDRGANCPHERAAGSPSSVGFPFHFGPFPASKLLRFCCYPSRRGRQGNVLFTIRLARTFSPAAYTFGLPTIGRRRASPVTTQDPLLQAAAGGTPVVHHRHSARPMVRGNQDFPGASPKGGGWRTTQAKNCRLPKSLCLAPSRRPLLRTSRWNRPGCLPSRKLRGSSREF